MLRFIDRHYPIFFAVVLFSLPIAGMTLASCSKTPEEKAEADARTLRWVQEDLVTFNPRPGVECYIIRGSSSTNPRVMSCVVIPPTMTTGQ